MSKKQKLDLVGYAGIIVHAPGGVLMTSGQPILMDKRLLKAATELIEHLKADALEDAVSREDLMDYIGISLSEAVIATTKAGEQEEDTVFKQLTVLLALAVHSQNSSHMIVEGRVNEDSTITVLNFFVVPTNDFDQGRQKILRYFEALNDLLAIPDHEESDASRRVVVH